MASSSDLGLQGMTNIVEIGRGGFGVVYRGTEDEFGRTVAIKVLSGDFDEQSRLRFDRERLALGSLSGHPNIVTVHRSGMTTSGTPFIVMEFLGGGSVADRIAAVGRLSVPEVRSVGVAVASALEAAHDSNVLHRDVKPGNVLLADNGTAKLGDFGIARLHGAPETQSAIITASLAHAPPEVIAGARPDDRADVYSLASTMFEMAWGRPAYVVSGETSLVPMLVRIAQEPVPDLRDVGLPDPLVLAIEAGMAKEPTDRPSAAQFGQLLAAVDDEAAHRSESVNATRAIVVDAAHTPRPPRNEGAREPQPRSTGEPTRRSVRRAVVAGVVILALGLAGMIGMIGANTSGDPSTPTIDALAGRERITPATPSPEPDLPTTTEPPAPTTAPPTTAPPTSPATTTAPPPTAAPTVLALSDSTGALRVNVPATWGQHRNGPGVIAAAPDLSAYDRGDPVPGMGLEAGFDGSGTVDVAAFVLDNGLDSFCTVDRFDAGIDAQNSVDFAIAEYSNCFGTSIAVYVHVTFAPDDGSYLIRNIQYDAAQPADQIEQLIASISLDQSLL